MLAYRLLAPLVVGGGLFALLTVLSIDPFRHADLPSWLPSILLRAICLGAVLGVVFGIGRLVSAVPRRAEFDGHAFRITRLFSGRSHRRMLSEVAAVSVDAPGSVSIRFKDGSRLNLEGRSGAGLALLTTAVRPLPR